jgi:Bacterial Ig-like domain (group 3)/SdrD B-like domain
MRGMRTVLDKCRHILTGSVQTAHPRSNRRRQLRVEELERREMLTADFWTQPVSGNWEDPTNWSAGVPGKNDIAVIDPTGPVTVTMSSMDTVQGIQTGSGNTLLLSGGAYLIFTDDITNNGQIEMQPTASANATLVFSYSVTLGGKGVLQFDGSDNGHFGIVSSIGHAGNPPDILTISAGQTVKSVGYGFLGYNLGGTIINQGLLEADGGGLVLQSSNVVNAGNCEAINGGALYVTTGLDNSQGVIDVDASSLNVNVFGDSGAAIITGGSVQLTNGSTLIVGVQSGGQQYPGSIIGSTLTLTGGSTLTGNFGTLDGVTVPAGSDVIVTPSDQANDTTNQTLEGTITDNGLIELMPSSSNGLLMYFSYAVTFDGGGVLQFDPVANGHYAIVSSIGHAGNSDTLTVSAGQTVKSIGYGYLGYNLGGSLINEGLIEADGGGLVLQSSSVANMGTCQAINGGTLYVTTGLDNSQGAIDVDSSSLNVNVFGSSGAADITGGTIQLTDGSTLTVGMQSGGQQYPGTITGSALDFTGGSMLTGSFGTLAGVSNISGSDLIIPSGTGLMLTGTVVNQGTVTQLGGLFTINGSSDELLNAASAIYDVQISGGDFVQGAGAFVNEGTLQRSVAGGTAIDDTTFSNPGIVKVLTGALSLPFDSGDVSGNTLTTGSWEVFTNATLTVDSGVSLTTNNTAITLDGTGSVFTNIASLASNGGSFSVVDGQSFTTSGDLSNTGSITIGSTDSLFVGGSYTQSAAGILNAQLGGTAAGQFSVLAVTNGANLNGTLNVSLVNGFTPLVPNSFPIVSYASCGGDFATKNGLDLGRGLVLVEQFNPTNLTLITSSQNVTITGREFNDLNGSGQDLGNDPGLQGWTIHLLDSNGNLVDSAITGANGDFSFTEAPGSYTIAEVPSNGWTQTYPMAPGTYSVTLSSGQSSTDDDFGNFQLVTVSGTVFNDLNDNHVQDNGEPGIPGVVVSLSNGQNATTDANGNYSVTGVGPGTFSMGESVPTGYMETYPTGNSLSFTTSSGTNVSQSIANEIPYLTEQGKPGFAGYHETGRGWYSVNAGWSGGQSREHDASSQAATADWTLTKRTGLPVAKYEVYVEWNVYDSPSPDALYKVYDGATLLKTIAIDQQNPPYQGTFEGFAWTSLGYYTVRHGRIDVILSDKSDGGVNADGTLILSAGSGQGPVGDPIALATRTMLRVGPNPSLARNKITLTAAVEAMRPGSGLPTGDVEFLDGTKVLGIANLKKVHGRDEAVLTDTALSVGTHHLTAVYQSNGTYAASISPTVIERVKAHPGHRAPPRFAGRDQLFALLADEGILFGGW